MASVRVLGLRHLNAPLQCILPQQLLQERTDLRLSLEARLRWNRGDDRWWVPPRVLLWLHVQPVLLCQSVGPYLFSVCHSVAHDDVPKTFWLDEPIVLTRVCGLFVGWPCLSSERSIIKRLPRGSWPQTS